MDMKIQLTLRNICDVIKILFADWSIKIFIVTYRKGQKNNHYSNLSGVYGHEKFNWHTEKYVWRHQNTVCWLVNETFYYDACAWNGS